MEYRQLGHSGIEVSVFSLGSWLTYEYMEEQEALAVLSRGLEAGINFLDDARYDDRSGTAPMKSGYSEVLFGRLLRRGRRDRLQRRFEQDAPSYWEPHRGMRVASDSRRRQY